MTVNQGSKGLPPEEMVKRIKKALKRGGDTYSWDDVSAGLLVGRYQWFANEHGVCITEIIQAPRKRYMNCFVVAGELPGVMDLHDRVEQYAKDSGCAFMMTSARMGWQSVLPNYGWKKHSMVFMRELNEASNG